MSAARAATLLAGALALLVPAGVRAQSVRAADIQVKAVFLYNFAQFVSWPPDALPDSQAMVLGVLGDDPFGAVLDETVRGVRAGGHAIEIRRYRRVGDVRDCHILFVSRSAADDVPELLSKLRTHPVLLVSDADGFAATGGTIGFVTDGRHVRLQINRRAAQAARLTISSKLLSLAELIGDGGN